MTRRHLRSRLRARSTVDDRLRLMERHQSLMERYMELRLGHLDRIVDRGLSFQQLQAGRQQVRLGRWGIVVAVGLCVFGLCVSLLAGQLSR